MAAFCVNTHSKLFKDIAKRLGVSEFELEQIAYKYGNQEGTFGQFPSDEYIKEQLDGVPNYNASEAQAELWKLRYSTPREFDTLEELNAAKKDALQYFDNNSIRSFVNADGKYELRIGKQEALENPETELKRAEEEVQSITRRIIEIEKQLRSKNIYENIISTSDGEIKVTISDSSKDSGEDKIWLSSGKSIFGAVSMSVESNLKNGTIGGSVIFPSDAIHNRGNNYQRLNNPIRRNHAEILKSVLKYFIDNGKSYPASKWMENGELSSERAALSEVFKIDLSPYFKVESRVKENKYNDEYDIEEQRVVVDAEKLYQALNFVSNGSNMLSITEALEYNEAYNEAANIGFGKDNKKQRKQLESEYRTAVKEQEELYGKIRNLKDEIRRMKSSPWAFNTEEDLPFQKSSDSDNITGLPDQMTADEVYQRLSQQYSPDSSEGKLSKLVFNTLQKTGITFRGVSMAPYWRGRFVASENVIEYNKAGILDNTLLHEAIHAVTTYYMSAANRDGFSNEIKIAIKEIEECYDLLKNDFLDQKLRMVVIERPILNFYTQGEYYGLTSATELVAEITRPSIVSLIRDYDARHKGQNVFQRLINAIAEFFGINKTYGSLERTLKEALVTLITNPNKALMDRYALENRTLKENFSKLSESSDAITLQQNWVKNAIPEEIPESGYDTVLELPKDKIAQGWVVNYSPDAHNVFTQSPVGTIFRVPIGDGYGFIILNGNVELTDTTVKVPVKVLSQEWLTLNTFDIATSQNGVAYMTNIKPLFGQQPSQQLQPQQPSFIQNAEFYSGAAQGSDSAWATEARKLGINVKEYTRQSWSELSQEWKDRLSAEYESVARDLGRTIIPLGGRGDIEVRRDMMQADKADAIFAIGRPVKPGERGAKYINRSNHEVVDGGTDTQFKEVFREAFLYICMIELQSNGKCGMLIL